MVYQAPRTTVTCHLELLRFRDKHHSHGRQTVGYKRVVLRNWGSYCTCITLKSYQKVLFLHIQRRLMPPSLCSISDIHLFIPKADLLPPSILPPSLIHSFIHSFICSFVPSFIHKNTYVPVANQHLLSRSPELQLHPELFARGAADPKFQSHIG